MMASALQITYLQHSGFALRTPDTLLIFDDAQGDHEEGKGLADGAISRELLEGHAHVLFFVSHAHSDHFSPAIYGLNIPGKVHYILGFDIPEPFTGHRMRPGDSYHVAGVDITAHASTDEGVSFLVRTAGWTLFHAGDLNLWHWREESTPKEIEAAEQAFFEAVEPLRGEAIDFAFFPLDPRMGAMYDAGMQYFLMHIKPSVVIPMHWWGQRHVSIDFARRNRTKHVEIVALTEPGETLRAFKQEDGRIMIDL